MIFKIVAHPRDTVRIVSIFTEFISYHFIEFDGCEAKVEKQVGQNENVKENVHFLGLLVLKMVVLPQQNHQVEEVERYYHDLKCIHRHLDLVVEVEDTVACHDVKQSLAD